MDWLPIETAPKDGSLVDLWCDRFRVVDCFWMPESDAFPSRAVGWVCTKNPGQPFHLNDIRAAPSHYMRVTGPA